MKKLNLLFLFLLFATVVQAERTVRIALIAGPNGYEEESFFPMMDKLKGVTWKAYTHPETQQLFAPEHSDEYDVLLFYGMCPEISETSKQQLAELIGSGKSVMVLHRGFDACNDWPEFGHITGSKHLLSAQKTSGQKDGHSSGRKGSDLNIREADPKYVITQGIKSITLGNEAPGAMWQSPGRQTWLKTDYPECAPNVRYTHHYGKGKVVGLALGPGSGTFGNKNYRRMFNRALLWLGDETKQDPVVVAYVTSWGNSTPNPKAMTHINYAFGHVNQTFNGIRIDNPDRLKMIVGLKQENPGLKVLLSVGGWGSGNFSEMAADQNNRQAFADDCRRVVEQFGLDGIDIDWEYPGSKAAGISASTDDKENYTLLMKEIRQAIGHSKLLTLASQAGAGHIDFPAVDRYADFINIMTYDMAGSPQHHAGLYRSGMTGWLSCDEAVAAHVKAGIPMHRLVLGIPFYGHGCERVPNFINYNEIIKLNGYTEKWDKKAGVPYLIDNETGKVVCNFENERSIKIKCRYLHEKGMRGAMYWDYDGDDRQGSLRQAVWNGTMESGRK